GALSECMAVFFNFLSSVFRIVYLSAVTWRRAWPTPWLAARYRLIAVPGCGAAGGGLWRNGSLRALRSLRSALFPPKASPGHPAAAEAGARLRSDVDVRCHPAQPAVAWSGGGVFGGVRGRDAEPAGPQGRACG